MIVRKLSYREPFKVFLSLVKVGAPVNLFLDSCQLNPKTSRFSFICIGIEEEVVVKGRGEGFEKLSREFERLKGKFEVKEVPYGLFGYASYEANRFLEKVPTAEVNDIGMPEIHFFLPATLLFFDKLKREAWLVSQEPFKVPEDKPYEGSFTAEFRGFNMTKDYFYRAVEKIKEYIASGDSFQVNFSQRLDFSFKGSSVELYRRLREINPSPFSFYMDLGGFKGVSCSPERLLRVEGNLAQTRPIAGTRRRGKDYTENERLERELFLSEKERAEHVMLVDLERNDLGKVCKYGTVEVDELMVPERYSHVVHIVSNVKGILKEGISHIDALKALFPGGTITGAPKVRTMEIIAELEPTWRNLYTGSVGYLGFNGVSDFNIVIRTLLIKEETAYLQVGAGIVWDSEANKEYKETLHKARALLASLGIKEI